MVVDRPDQAHLSDERIDGFSARSANSSRSANNSSTSSAIWANYELIPKPEFFGDYGGMGPLLNHHLG